MTTNLASGIAVPTPTLPLPVTNRILELAGDPTLNNGKLLAPEMCNKAVGPAEAVVNTPGPIPISVFGIS